MIHIHLTPDDLSKMRFAYRPLLEIPLSLRVLTNPDFQTHNPRWMEEARWALNDIELPYLKALVTPHGYIPDFLTPTPLTNRVEIEEDFDEILATPEEVIRANIQMLIEQDGDSEMRRYFLIYPREAVICLIEDMRRYWKRTLAHYWFRMISTLESDVLYRGRMLLLNGPATLFEDLHPSITLQRNKLQLAPVCQHIGQEVEVNLEGQGLQLVPTIFRGCGRMYLVEPGWHPMLAYGVRGNGLWHQKPPTQSLELALGSGRARVLEGLRTPATTTALAQKLQISAGTASTHLSRLQKAGLVEPHRSGKRVYYRLTQRGEDLIALFERIY